MELQKFFRFSIFALAALTFVACEDDDDDDTPPDVNEEELITDLVLNFFDPDAQTTLTYRFSDPDGPGGNDPVIDDIVLDQNVAYNVSVEVLDASNPNDVEDITTEIQAEDEEHQFFYILENGASNVLTVSYLGSDVDANGNPIGLETGWITTGETSGGETVKVILLHEPDKNAEGVSDGDPANAGGKTDIEVTFNLTIN
jgi:hypothetical protein